MKRATSAVGISIAFFLFALWVRLPFLGYADLWCDEILFYWFSAPPMTPWQVVLNQWRWLLTVTHMPFPEVVQNVFLWISSFLIGDVSHNPWVQRLPAVLWGSFTVPVFHKMTRSVLPQPARLGATLMVCFFLFPVYYSRESYYYAPLIFCSTAVLTILLGSVCGDSLTPRRITAFVLAGTGMAYSHITGVATAFLVSLCACLAWGALRYQGESKAARETGKAALFSLIPLLAVSPWVLKFALNKLISDTRPGTPLGAILYDVPAKFFMGSAPHWPLAATIVFGCGIIAIALPSDKSMPRRVLLVFLAIGVTALTISASKTLYHVRYFSALMPAIYVAFAAGLYWISGLLFRRFANTAFFALLIPLLAIHLLIYLPHVYRLKAKSDNYAGVAKWLNKNLAPGEPFLCESSYWLRFVSGYFPTPRRTGAAPYTPGAAPEDLSVMQKKHEEFLRQFPMSPLIDVRWFDTMDGRVFDENYDSWNWAKQFFRRRMDLHNPGLESMSDLGIHLSIGREAPVTERCIRIWYNTDDDIVKMARERGMPAIFQWSGWSCEPYAQNPMDRSISYGWVSPRNFAELVLRNLTGKPLPGRLKLDFFVLGETGDARFILSQGENVLADFPVQVGSMNSVETQEFILPEEKESYQVKAIGKRMETIGRLLILPSSEFIQTE